MATGVMATELRRAGVGDTSAIEIRREARISIWAAQYHGIAAASRDDRALGVL
jgi:hypothetical protein